MMRLQIHVCIFLLVCRRGRYGPSCEYFCDCDNGASCDSTAGHCKCRPGWIGANCRIGEGTMSMIVFLTFLNLLCRNIIITTVTISSPHFLAGSWLVVAVFLHLFWLVNGLMVLPLCGSETASWWKITTKVSYCIIHAYICVCMNYILMQGIWRNELISINQIKHFCSAWNSTLIIIIFHLSVTLFSSSSGWLIPFTLSILHLNNFSSTQI